MKQKTLHLVLKGKWYDMIASGEKREEYRKVAPYWWKRLTVDDCQCPCTFLSDTDASGNKREDLVTFHRGYTRETMTFKIEKNRGRPWAKSLGSTRKRGVYHQDWRKNKTTFPFK